MRFIGLLRQWDRSTQLAMGLALAFLAIAFGVYVLNIPDTRAPAIVAIFGLLIVIQIIVMWGNRGMVTVYTRAQRLYLDGEIRQAIELLESVRQQDKADFRMLTLLGNAYRQVGELGESEKALRQAVAMQPNHHFPQYGFGRTLLVKGNFVEAIQAFRNAQENGAPEMILADMGEAYYRAEDWDTAREILERAALLESEPHQKLMTSYLLYRLHAGSAPDDDLLQAGLLYWDASVERFAHVPYGQMLADDVYSMRAITQE